MSPLWDDYRNSDSDDLLTKGILNQVCEIKSNLGELL